MDDFDSVEEEAVGLANSFGMKLVLNPDGFWQLEHNAKGWLINLSPATYRRGGRIWHEPGRMGPKLAVPRRWLLVEAVIAAVNAEQPGAVEPLSIEDGGGAIRRPNGRRGG